MPSEPENTKLKIRFLKAFKGDAILISLFENDTPRNILIDGGEAGTYSDDDNEPGELKEVIDNIKKKRQKLDLLILTHIDDDHIGGILKWFEEDEKAFEWIEEVWFNSGGLIAKVLKEP